MAAWISPNHKWGPTGFQRDMRCILSPKPTLNLMQNCDLPPPIKLVSGPDQTFLSSISQEAKKKDDHVPMYEDCSGNKLEILKALRLSQTRAREAERKLRIISKEKDELSNLLVDDSLRLFAYRQWVNLLEFQVLRLQRQQQLQGENSQNHYGETNFAEKSRKDIDCDEGSSSNKLCTAIAFCFAIAGIGFAFGCRYLI